jgi:prolipoprotein diacylglyceryl transferase
MPPLGVAMAALASIPSPSSNRLGPFTAYGLMIALGVIVAVEIARRRWAARGGDPDDMSSIALWAVPAGLIGARLYHVITDNELYRGSNWVDAFKVWQGGLGIPGGILAGVGVGVLVARRRHIRLAPALDSVAVAIPVAQAIGRLGNWFNQELFGSPTTLPWALSVKDSVARAAGYAPGTTFHPTFLYEGLWNLGLAGVLVLLDRRRIVRPGRLFVLYVGGYFTGRLWVEALRIDKANTILGLRVNTWTSLVVVAGCLVVLAVGGVRRREGDSDEPYVEGSRRGNLDGSGASPDGLDEPADEADIDATPGDGAPAKAADDP